MSESDLSAQQFLTARQRDRPVVLPELLSDEKLARDWTLTVHDLDGIASFTKQYRLVNAVQLRTVRLFGRFLRDPAQIPPKIVAYIAAQIGQPPPLTVQAPMREATLLEQQKRILQLVGFRRFDDAARSELEAWLEDQARHGDLPASLFERAERFLLRHQIVLPGPTTLERLVIAVCARSQEELFESIYAQLSPELRLSIDALLTAPEGEQRSFFHQLKEYPPSPTIKSMNRYLERYREVQDLFLGGLGMPAVEPAFADYLSQIAGGYSAKDIKRFQDEKRHALMACFLHESRKVVLDHLVEMHDKFMLNMCRDAKSAHETQYRALRKRQKAAIDAVMRTTAALLDWPQDEPRTRDDFWGREDERRLRDSITDLKVFQRLEERGYGDRLLARYPSLRKYFAEFVRLPFAVEKGSEPLLAAINLVRRLDAGELRSLPQDAPSAFVPGELRPALRDRASGALNRNAWETGLGLAIRDAFRSGDLYLPESKQHVSFWDLLLTDSRWDDSREESYLELQKPPPGEVRTTLADEFRRGASEAELRFAEDPFAQIEHGRFKLRRDDLKKPTESHLQKTLSASLLRPTLSSNASRVDRHTIGCRRLSGTSVGSSRRTTSFATSATESYDKPSRGSSIRASIDRSCRAGSSLRSRGSSRPVTTSRS